MSDFEHVTLDGYDGADLVVKRINLWRDYANRGKGVVCSVRHGHPAQLLERQGDACRIRVEWEGRAQEGWVTYWFLKELKSEWQLSRLGVHA
jgi:hypothetical protein